MNRPEKIMILVSLTLALGAWLPLVQGLRAQPNIREYGLKGHIQVSRFSPPQSGVSLIEEILWRVRSTPRLAMAVSSTKNQSPFVRNYGQSVSEEKQEQAKKGVTDYTLAIKPKEKLLPYREQDESTVATGKLSWKADSKAPPSKAKYYSAPRQTQVLDDRPAVRDFREPIASSSSNLRAGGGYGGGARSSSASAPSPASMPTATPSSMPPPIIAAKQIAKRAKASSQYIAQAPAPMPVPMYDGESATGGAVDDLGSAATQSRADRFRRNASADADSNVAAPPSPSVLSEAKDSQPLKVAMRPTRMVTGIPQLKLGVSEAESRRSFKAFGNIKKDVISDWTVWTYFRPGVKAPAMQVYVHQGFVEAMRIFDQELISAELGVHLGDDLGTVKEQFGEPAFIIPEPTPGSGHNYIYPLSRVGFHLMRPDANKMPQVVSMLIFHAR